MDVTQDGRALEEFGRRLFIDRHGRLRDLGKSWLLNGIGASTLAFTSDGKLLLVHQSEHNLNSARLLAPSGSGALEPKDFGGLDRVPVQTLAQEGGNRELLEESTVRADEIVATHFLSFGRWLDKAGRPELYSLALLSCDSHELESRAIDRNEKLFVKRREFTRLIGSPEDWDPAHPDLMLEAKFRGRLSVPLSVCLSQLAVRARIADDPLSALVPRIADRS